MAVKKVKTIIKLNLPAGEATPAPPLGPALGSHGLPIMDFVKEYNARTLAQKGNIVPVVITVYEDRTFSFETKTAPVSELIKKELGLEKGLSKDQVRKIAQEKLKDLNTQDLDAAMRTVEGTARSMGVKVE